MLFSFTPPILLYPSNPQIPYILQIPKYPLNTPNIYSLDIISNGTIRKKWLDFHNDKIAMNKCSSSQK